MFKVRLIILIVHVQRTVGSNATWKNVVTEVLENDLLWSLCNRNPFDNHSRSPVTKTHGSRHQFSSAPTARVITVLND